MHWSFTVFTLTIVAYTDALVVYSLYSNDCGLHPCIGRLQSFPLRLWLTPMHWSFTVFSLTIVAYTHALVV